ncbi:MAG: hypothetical protein ABI729_08325 [Chitinophagales bacterium]
MNLKTLIALNLLIASVCLLGCSEGNTKPEVQLGELEFVVTGNAESQPYFKKGLLLLHSFEYDDAAENFSKAHETDSSFVMAYWGEAMTYNHPLWRYQNKEKADSILKLLAANPDLRVSKAKTDIEKDFIKAVDILYGDGSKAERDDKYATFMSSLYEKYSGHAEVASFYSIALLGSVEVGRDTAVYGHAATVAKTVLAKNPNHPGALHYLIHSYDDPDHAALALDAADAYAKVAPSASHALHMPSHIYLALGMWDKVISSNEAAWAASEQRKERKGLDNDALGYHSFHWLMYALLQKGRNEEAKKMVVQMKQYCDSLSSSRAREHVILLKSTYLVESNDWQSEISSIAVKEDDLNVGLRAMSNFVNGMKAFHDNDEKQLTAVISTMHNERMLASGKIIEASGHSCGSVNANSANLLDVQYAEVMEMELQALSSQLKKDSGATDNWYKQATALENSVSYSFGPPSVVKPSNEMYGEWLLTMKRPSEAITQFELALKAAPNRTLSVNGLAAATSQLNEKKAVATK